MRIKKSWPLAVLAAALSAPALAATENYTLDPEHTFPSFEADHMGISLWRGKFNGNSGKATFDKATGTGTVNITVDMASVDFGHDKLNTWAVGPDFFDTAKYPTATYQGKFAGIVKGVPTRVEGQLQLRGITKPVTLKINSFKCIQHPMFKRDYCGADASATINREEFGIIAGKPYGFSMNVVLRIQVEALQDQ